jgi:hypothetical protein
VASDLLSAGSFFSFAAFVSRGENLKIFAPVQTARTQSRPVVSSPGSGAYLVAGMNGCKAPTPNAITPGTKENGVWRARTSREPMDSGCGHEPGMSLLTELGNSDSAILQIFRAYGAFPSPPRVSLNKALLVLRRFPRCPPPASRRTTHS